MFRYIKEMDLKINMSVEGIATSSLDENEVISNDVITKISFAAGGEKGECVNPNDIFFYVLWVQPS